MDTEHWFVLLSQLYLGGQKLPGQDVKEWLGYAERDYDVVDRENNEAETAGGG